MLWVAGRIIDEVSVNLGVASPRWGWLSLLVLIEFLLALAADVFARVSGVAERILAEIYSKELSVALMRHVGQLDLQHLEDASFFDKLKRGRALAESTKTVLSETLTLLQQGLGLVALLTALAAYNLWLVVLLAVAIVPSFLGESRYARITYELKHRWAERKRQLDYLRWVSSEPEPAKEVRLLNLSGYLADRFDTVSTQYVDETRRIAARRAAVGAALAFLSTAAYYAAFGVMAYHTVRGIFTIGELAFLTTSFQRSRGLLANVLMAVVRAYEHGLQVRDLFDVFETMPRVKSIPHAPNLSPALGHEILFDDVGYRYGEQDSWAVRHLSFEVSRGECVALVGRNGAGKSTVVKLLARLYDPTEGMIALDGRDIREYSIESVRAAISVVFQDCFRFDFSMRDNIVVGDLRRPLIESSILAAADAAGARSLIESLPGGLDQVLGQRFSNARSISGGEWQKVALSRVHYRRAPILILDEPTASLDARAEAEVYRCFRATSEGRTTILISHRLSAVRLADRIIVLDDGQIVEDGTHDELVRKSGLYSDLYHLQASAYGSPLREPEFSQLASRRSGGIR